MIVNPTHRIAAASLAVLACAIAASPARAQQFTVTDLGALSGPVSEATAINSAGIIVGSSMATANGSAFHGFSWDGSMTNLLPLSGDDHSNATAINDAGTIVGVSYILGDLQPRAVRWTSGGRTNLGDFTPQAVNAFNRVAGTRSLTSTTPGMHWIERACFWQNSTITTLGTLGGSVSQARGLDNDGWIVGSSSMADDLTTHAFVWNNSAMIDLGTLGGPDSQAYAINNSHQAVGFADNAAGRPHAVMFTLSTIGGLKRSDDLGELGGGYSYALAINDAGAVVGVSKSHAFLWQNGVMVDLNQYVDRAAGWTLSTATGINQDGWIVGRGLLGRFPRGFLLKPIGEPCPPIARPSGVLASNGAAADMVKITWNAVPGAQSYQVWRKQGSGSLELIADGVTGTKYKDFTPPACVTFKYRVSALSACGWQSSLSAADSGWRGTTCAALMAADAAAAPAGGLNDQDAAEMMPWSDLRGDVDGDGALTAADIQALVLEFGPCSNCRADLTGDGQVNLEDLLMLLADWIPTPAK